ncbi:MAG: hypothetical protein H0U23_15730 [Blastocatellia bacterium]|nr:hypothetical protein [Blastocatellia bacterium]
MTDTSATQMGRMFAFNADVMATVYTQTNYDPFQIKVQRLGVIVYSPTAQTYTNLELDTQASIRVGFVVTAVKMADFNRDGFDDLVVNYAKPNGQSAIQIINAKNVNAFAEGLIARGENLQTVNMGIYRITGGDGNPEIVGVDTMTVGDFNGDGKLEIIGVISGEVGEGVGLQLVVHTVDEKTLQISDAKYFTLFGDTIGDPLPTPLSQIAAAVGRFTTTTHDQLLVSHAVNGGVARVRLIDFDPATFRPQELSLWSSDNTIKTGRYGVFDWTGLLKLRVGRINWSSQYDQAVLLHGNNYHRVAGSSSYEFTLSNLAISPADFSIREQSNFKTGDNYGTMHDIALGNFDNRTRDPLNPNQTERNPNLQVSLLTTDASGYTANVAIFNVDPVTSALNQFSTYSLLQEAPQHNLRFIAGDMQGRSMRFGEPTKITINGTAQPTVVAAAPPMHVDFMAPIGEKQAKVLNVSAIPNNFYTSYETEEKKSNQSSTTHTTSWSFGAKEKIGASFQVGSLKSSGVKFSDTFTAAQALKGSIENTHGTYASKGFDISQETEFSDQLWFSQSRFNIYIYPVIGQTVCPAKKADENGNCADSDKVPLTIQFSGPDIISSTTMAANIVEWYQPPWEYGNIFSYPSSYAQLQQIYPDINKLSTDVTFATDENTFAINTNWDTNTKDSERSSLNQNYSFENDFSVQDATGIKGVDVTTISGEFDTSGSFGFNDLNKSTTTLGKSAGIGVHKPGTFLDSPNYNYSVTPYHLRSDETGRFG